MVVVETSPVLASPVPSLPSSRAPRRARELMGHNDGYGIRAKALESSNPFPPRCSSGALWPRVRDCRAVVSTGGVLICQVDGRPLVEWSVDGLERRTASPAVNPMERWGVRLARTRGSRSTSSSDCTCVSVCACSRGAYKFSWTRHDTAPVPADPCDLRRELDEAHDRLGRR